MNKCDTVKDAMIPASNYKAEILIKTRRGRCSNAKTNKMKKTQTRMHFVPMRGLKKVLMNSSYLSRSGLSDPIKAEPLTVIVIKITQRKPNETDPNDYYCCNSQPDNCCECDHITLVRRTLTLVTLEKHKSKTSSKT